MFSGPRRASGVQGLRLILQSDREPKYLESRMEAFLLSIEEHLSKMTDETFADHVKALSTRRLEKPKKLSAQNSRYWSEIISQQYNFDRGELDWIL